ncbi:hypothetical protein NDU88_002267 [Pleurodeles waltl]|uniref:Uncharacterized protein n=1 Tax=Pleurodeles waltl TaxID=8319 RepID=A0AAV7KV62_PLEWA|nr:hypothetical protein NDU88_002267 [Pleurodeles waltl]
MSPLDPSLPDQWSRAEGFGLGTPATVTGLTQEREEVCPNPSFVQEIGCAALLAHAQEVQQEAHRVSATMQGQKDAIHTELDQLNCPENTQKNYAFLEEVMDIFQEELQERKKMKILRDERDYKFKQHKYGNNALIMASCSL